MYSKKRSKTKLAFWTLLCVIVGVLLGGGIIPFFNKLSLVVKPSGATIVKVVNAPLEPHKETNEQKYFYINKDLVGGPKVSAKAYLVGDLNTGEVLLSKNQDTKYPIASTTKVMTALVAKEIGKADDVGQISRTALQTYGTNGKLRLGEKIKTFDLVYPLLLESSNDAAEAIAEHFGRKNFITKMNQEAERLKMEHTSYADPSGLSEKNISTVADLFKLSGYVHQNKPELFSITTRRSFSNKQHTWSNISQFLGDDGYLGGKSGYTDEAKQTVISLFNLPLGKEGHRPIAITLLQSPDRRKDVETLLAYIKKNIYYGGPQDAVTDWVKEKVGVPDIREPDFVTLAFVGDIMLDRGVKNSVIRNFANDYSALFSKSKELSNILQRSDITFGNLEGPVSDKGVDRKNLYSFRMDPSTVPALKGAGFKIFSVANNHVGDWGRIAYTDTLERLKENEILYTGGGNTRTEAEMPTIIEKYGIKVGFLAFSDVGPDWMAVTDTSAGLLLAKNPRFDEIVKNAASMVDYLVVSFHFGDEYKTVHNSRQEYLAHRAVDNGAKLVIGHHPHVVEDTEVYKNSFIAYSLGNFIFDQAFSVNTMQGALLNVKLYKDGRLGIRKDTVKLNSVFQPETLIKGKEEIIKFAEEKKEEKKSENIVEAAI